MYPACGIVFCVKIFYVFAIYRFFLLNAEYWTLKANSVFTIPRGGISLRSIFNFTLYIFNCTFLFAACRAMFHHAAFAVNPLLIILTAIIWSATN